MAVKNGPQREAISDALILAAAYIKALPSDIPYWLDVVDDKPVTLDVACQHPRHFWACARLFNSFPPDYKGTIHRKVGALEIWASILPDIERLTNRDVAPH